MCANSPKDYTQPYVKLKMAKDQNNRGRFEVNKQGKIIVFLTLFSFKTTLARFKYLILDILISLFLQIQGQKL
jgi:hypothetical protein